MLKNSKPDRFFIKLLSFNSLGIMIRLSVGFILNKVIAVTIGPAGLGILGNLRSFITSIETISSLGLKKAIVTYVAQNKESNNKISNILTTAIYVGLIWSLICGTLLFIFSNYWSNYVFKTTEYSFVIKTLAVGLFFITINGYCLSYINGLEKFKTFIGINIASSILGLGISLLLLYLYDIKGVMYALVSIPALILIVTLSVLLYNRKELPLIKNRFFDSNFLLRFFEYSLMAVFTALLVPPTLIAIRNHIVDVDGTIGMGYWEAVNRISNYNLMFTTSLLNLYWFPKLSKITSKLDFRNAVINIYKNLIPIIGTGLVFLYFIKSWVIKLLFSKSFMPIEDLFSWQLCGDFFKIISTILATQFIAKKMTKSFLITEALSVAVWYGASILFINKFGFKGASMGYFTCYFLYFIMLLFWFRKSLFLKIR